jgi:hypothetical protein
MLNITQKVKDHQCQHVEVDIVRYTMVQPTLLKTWWLVNETKAVRWFEKKADSFPSSYTSLCSKILGFLVGEFFHQGMSREQIHLLYDKLLFFNDGSKMVNVLYLLNEEEKQQIKYAFSDSPVVDTIVTAYKSSINSWYKFAPIMAAAARVAAIGITESYIYKQTDCQVTYFKPKEYLPDIGLRRIFDTDPAMYTVPRSVLYSWQQQPEKALLRFRDLLLIQLLKFGKKMYTAPQKLLCDPFINNVVVRLLDVFVIRSWSEILPILEKKATDFISFQNDVFNVLIPIEPLQKPYHLDDITPVTEFIAAIQELKEFIAIYTNDTFTYKAAIGLVIKVCRQIMVFSTLQIGKQYFKILGVFILRYVMSCIEIPLVVKLLFKQRPYINDYVHPVETRLFIQRILYNLLKLQDQLVEPLLQFIDYIVPRVTLYKQGLQQVVTYLECLFPSLAIPGDPKNVFHVWAAWYTVIQSKDVDYFVHDLKSILTTFRDNMEKEVNDKFLQQLVSATIMAVTDLHVAYIKTQHPIIVQLLNNIVQNIIEKLIVPPVFTIDSIDLLPAKLATMFSFNEPDTTFRDQLATSMIKIIRRLHALTMYTNKFKDLLDADPPFTVCKQIAVSAVPPLIDLSGNAIFYLKDKKTNCYLRSVTVEHEQWVVAAGTYNQKNDSAYQWCMKNDLIINVKTQSFLTALSNVGTPSVSSIQYNINPLILKQTIEDPYRLVHANNYKTNQRLTDFVPDEQFVLTYMDKRATLAGGSFIPLSLFHDCKPSNYLQLIGPDEYRVFTAEKGTSPIKPVKLFHIKNMDTGCYLIVVTLHDQDAIGASDTKQKPIWSITDGVITYRNKVLTTIDKVLLKNSMTHDAIPLMLVDSAGPVSVHAYTNGQTLRTGIHGTQFTIKMNERATGAVMFKPWIPACNPDHYLQFASSQEHTFMLEE